MSKRVFLNALLSVCLLILTAGSAVQAEEVTYSFDFAVDTWFELGATDGPVTLNRIRLDRKEGRFTKSVVNRPYNHKHLESIGVQLEYTNNASSKWRAQITATWFDADGQVIDGLTVHETLEKKSASKIEEAVLSTLKYGLQKAHNLEITIRFEP